MWPCGCDYSDQLKFYLSMFRCCMKMKKINVFVFTIPLEIQYSIFKMKKLKKKSTNSTGY